MRGLTHPYTGALYDNTEDDKIVVTLVSGESGVFDKRGVWRHGEVRECDRVFAMWVAGEQLLHHKLGDVSGRDNLD